MSSRSIAKIKKNFPFNQATKIKIASFKRPGEEGRRKIPTLNGNVAVDSLFEIVALTDDAEGELLDLLMNFGYKPVKNGTGEVYFCYEPRNAIFFEDSKGNIFAYMELCFDCHNYETQPEKLNLGQFCFEKYDLLRQFFVKQGIKYVAGN